MNGHEHVFVCVNRRAVETYRDIFWTFIHRAKSQIKIVFCDSLFNIFKTVTLHLCEPLSASSSCCADASLTVSLIVQKGKQLCFYQIMRWQCPWLCLLLYLDGDCLQIILLLEYLPPQIIIISKCIQGPRVWTRKPMWNIPLFFLNFLNRFL